MPTWKKVVVSGSQAELNALKVDNLTSGQVVIGGGQAANLSTRVISGSGAILADGGSGIQLTGSFSGSFTGRHIGTSSWATNAVTANQVANSLSQGSGITTFTYNGSSAQTVAVSGTVGMATNVITKWTGTAFTASTLTDNGTTITGASSIQLTGANSSLTGSFTGSFVGAGNLTGSFTGSFRGDGSGLNGVIAQSAFALAFGEGIGLNAQGSSSYNGGQPVTISVSGAADLNDGRLIRWDNTANKLTNSLIFDDGTNVQITGSTVTISGSSAALIVTGSVRASAGFTGSLFGTSSWAANATNALTASFVGNLNQSLVITGSITISGSTGPELIVLGETQFTGSVNSLGGFTGSLLGTASWANNATQVANSLTAGNGLTGTAFNGSAASTFDVGAGALITVNPDVVMVTTSSLSVNQIPKFSNNSLSGSNISDDGNTVTISRATSISQGGLTVTGNSTFNNNLTVTGNLNVAGTASFTNTDSLFIADKFIALASGSTTLTQAGIIAVSSTTANGMTGSAFFLDNVGNIGRWAITGSLNSTASSATGISEYMVSVTVNQASAPAAATKPIWGSDTNNTNAGSMWVQTNGDIYIYS